MRRAVTRIGHEIVERNKGIDGVVLVGLQRGGVWIAEALGAAIARSEPDRTVPVGRIDASCTATTSGCGPSCRRR